MGIFKSPDRAKCQLAGSTNPRIASVCSEIHRLNKKLQRPRIYKSTI